METIPIEPKKRVRRTKAVILSDEVQKLEELDPIKYTNKGHIRASWIRSEAKKKAVEDTVKVEELAKILMEKQRVKDEAIKMREDKRKQDKERRDNERRLKKAEEKANKVDMRGKTEKCKEFHKRNNSKLKDGLRNHFLKLERERRKNHPDSDESDTEEITIIKKKKSRSTPEIDYRKLYEESIRKNTIREERDEPPTRSSSASPNINRIRDIQRTIFRGIL